MAACNLLPTASEESKSLQLQSIGLATEILAAGIDIQCALTTMDVSWSQLVSAPEVKTAAEGSNSCRPVQKWSLPWRLLP